MTTTNKKYVLAIDQGTSSTKSIIFDEEGKALFKASEPLHTHYLPENRVEQDPEAIYENVLDSVNKCLEIFKSNGGELDQITACGISNQRETFVLWDASGKPLYNAVVWQCKRSIDVCERLEREGFAQRINEKTGLIIDPYFSGTKVIWLYENEPEIKKAIDAGTCFFGNVDTWLLYRLTNGKAYFTDYTNASRTLFFNLKDLEWDKELLADFGLTGLQLPTPKPSSFFYGETNLGGALSHAVNVTAMIGDSHAAAFGEGCFEPGTAKATLGTGSSILMNIGSEPKSSQNGMVTTICWSMEGRVDYALEGIIVSAGSTIEWVKNQLGLFENTADLESICLSLNDNGGVNIVPAFSGLGAPHWDMNRRASIEGLSFDSTKEHVIRAAVESVPFQIKQVIDAMESDSGTPLTEIKIDGGITSNSFVVQLLADILQRKVITIRIPDVSAMGAAYLAGLKSKVYESLEQLSTINQGSKTSTAGENSEKALVDFQSWTNIIG